MAYTGKATYKKLDKKGEVTSHGACIDIYQDDTMLKKCFDIWQMGPEDPGIHKNIITCFEVISDMEITS